MKPSQASGLLAILALAVGPTAPAATPASDAYIPISGSAWRLALGDVDGDGQRELIAGLYQERIACIDPRTETTRWEQPLPAYPFALAAEDVTGDGRAEVFVACADGSIRAFGPDGSPKWTYAPNHGAKHALTLLRRGGDAAPLVVAAGKDRTLLALEAETGRLAASLDVRAAVHSDSSRATGRAG